MITNVRRMGSGYTIDQPFSMLIFSLIQQRVHSRKINDEESILKGDEDCAWDPTGTERRQGCRTIRRLSGAPNSE
jgi:hypothetical protein